MITNGDADGNLINVGDIVEVIAKDGYNGIEFKIYDIGYMSGNPLFIGPITRTIARRKSTCPIGYIMKLWGRRLRVKAPVNLVKRNIFAKKGWGP